MSPAHQRQQTDSACGCGSGCSTPPVVSQPVVSEAPVIESRRFRIANMDCASEESEIRRALEGKAGIRSLQFNLGARELAIAADDPALQQALDAIRKAGFKPEPLSGAGPSATAAAAAPPPGFWTTWGKSLGALGLAMVAEGLAFALPDSGPSRCSGWRWPQRPSRCQASRSTAKGLPRCGRAA